MRKRNLRRRLVRAERPPLLAGVCAALLACLIGAGWQVMTRQGVTTSLAPLDLALFRYAIPGLVLAPVWIRCGLMPEGVTPLLLAAMVLGAGLPFGLLVVAGAQFAPVAHMGALLPGVSPLLVAFASAIVLGDRLTPVRLAGFCCILLGVAFIGWEGLVGADSGAWRGHVLFVLAACAWAAYTVAFRKSGLSPWRATAVVTGWSLFLVVPLWLASGSDGIAVTDPRSLAAHAAWQGIVAGLLGLWIYAFSVSSLGPGRAAAIGALVPVFSAIGGWLYLAETITMPTATGISLVAVGVLVSTGIVKLSVKASWRVLRRSRQS